MVDVTPHGNPCSRSHERTALHTVYGYEPGCEPSVARRGVAITDGDEADRLRDAAMAERPDLDWCVEWRLADG